MNKSKKLFARILIMLTVIASVVLYSRIFGDKRQIQEHIFTELADLRSYSIKVHTVGQLEAMRSTSITSSIKGDLGKIIYLVPDGLNVKVNEALVKMDPTPFEELVEELKRKIQEQQSKIAILEGFVELESYQVEREEMAAQIEIETAELEINKMIYGDGAIEEARLKLAMQKSLAKFEELKSYTDDLMDLEAQGFLNPIELKQAEKKLAEEEESYLSGKVQYESFINHTQPIQIKKAEAVLRRNKNKYEEAIKAGIFKIAKSRAQLDLAIQERADLQNQLANAEQQMILTEIKAPTPGMVVLKEEFRSGVRRKPRLGDILIKNQPILDLPDLEAMLVKTKVREIDLFKIDRGTPATIEIDAYPDLRFQGKISSIGVLAVSDVMKTGDEKYFDVIVEMDSSDPRLRPGMTARISIHVSQVDNKFTIPVQAVFEFNKNYYCFVKKDEGCTAVPIEIGLSNDTWVEIKSGLEEKLPVLLSMPLWSDVKNANEIIGKSDVNR